MARLPVRRGVHHQADCRLSALPQQRLQSCRGSWQVDVEELMAFKQAGCDCKYTVDTLKCKHEQQAQKNPFDHFC